MTIKQQQRDEWRKNDIRKAAIRCYVRRGFAATRLRDVADEAGLSKGGVYFHYRAKDDLFLDILETLRDGIEKRWTFTPDAAQPADRVLHSLVTAQLRALEDEPEEMRLVAILNSMAPQDAAVREKLDEGQRVIRSLYAGVIERGLAEGTFASGNPEELARSIVAFVQGLGYASTMDVDGRLPVRPEHAANLVLRMVGASPIGEGDAVELHEAAASSSSRLTTESVYAG